MSSPSKKLTVGTPLTFDLSEELLARIERSRLRAGLSTTSEVIRAAVDQFDMEGVVPLGERPNRQVSVRLSLAQRVRLKHTAASKHMSIGELLRLAIEAMPETKPPTRASR